MRLPAARMGPDLDLPEDLAVGPWTRSLHVAIEHHDLDAVQWALAKGADPARLWPMTLTDLDDGNIQVVGGYNALHHAVMQTFPEQAAEDVETPPQIHLGILQALLETHMDPNTLSYPWPEANTALEGLIWSIPENLQDATRLLLEYGAKPRATTLALLAGSNHPDSVALISVLLQAVPEQERIALLTDINLKDLTNQELSPVQLVCLRELVKAGISLDRPFRGSQRGSKTPAEAILKHNPNGDQMLHFLNPERISSRAKHGRP